MNDFHALYSLQFCAMKYLVVVNENKPGPAQVAAISEAQK